MDFLVKHWGHFSRFFPSAFPVANTDYLDHKKEWISRKFAICSFSLILRGRGEFLRAGKTWQVEAPCVITQWPGEYVEYGPTLPDQTWDELYIDYDADLLPKFRQCQFVDFERPVRPIEDFKALSAPIAELTLLAQSPAPEFLADRLDRVCERILLETWYTDPDCMANSDPVIHNLMVEMQKNFSKLVDCEAEARRHGMSLASFRRRWAATCKIPPSRYLQQLRIREACRLLVETHQTISEIGSAVGFLDQFYFSRRFRNETNLSPSEYRDTYRIFR